MAVNDPQFSDGSCELIQTSSSAPVVYFADGSCYIVLEYQEAAGGLSIPRPLSRPLSGPLGGI